MFVAIVERKWLNKRIPETDVHQPAFVECDEQRHVIEFRTPLAFRVGDTRGKHFRVETERT